jgi:hypothetical protein
LCGRDDNPVILLLHGSKMNRGDRRVRKEDAGLFAFVFLPVHHF